MRNPKVWTELTITQKELLSRYTSHRPNEKGIKDMREIRRYVRALALTIEDLCPRGPEKHLALHHLSIVMMTANTAIAQKYPIDERDL